MVIDCHNHVGEPWGTRDRQTPDELLRKMDRAGIDMAVIFGFKYENYDNEYTYKAVKAHPDRFIGFARIAPWLHKNYGEVLEQDIDKYDFKGIKIHAAASSFMMTSLAVLRPIFDVADKREIPVIAYSGDEVCATAVSFRYIAKEYPKVPIIMAHSGFMHQTPESIMVAKECSNIYLEHASDTTGAYTSSLEELGPDRIIMGTDTPYWDYEVQLKKIEVTILKKEDREKFMGHNIAKLLKINASLQ